MFKSTLSAVAGSLILASGCSGNSSRAPDADAATDAATDGPIDGGDAGPDGPDLGEDHPRRDAADAPEGGCLAVDAAEGDAGEPLCTVATDAFASLAEYARVLSGTRFVPTAIDACPDLDRPTSGQKDARGLVFEEFSCLVAGSRGNIVDDGTWWTKALPRGEALDRPILLYDEACNAVTYDSFAAAKAFDYACATPPINVVPSCGKYLAGFQVGHRVAGMPSWPQVLQAVGSAYVRLVPLQQDAAFGTSFRIATEDATLPTEVHPSLSRVRFVQHDAASMAFTGVVESRAFTAAFRAKLKPGKPTSLAVDLTIFPRAGVSCGDTSIGLAAFSSMFWKGPLDTPAVSSDEAHDADTLVVKYGNAAQVETPLANPALPMDGKSWQRRVFADASGLTRVSLRQSERNPMRYAAYASARYEARPTLSVDVTSTSVALEAELAAERADGEFFDNVVVVVRPRVPLTAPASVSYVVTAEQ